MRQHAQMLGKIDPSEITDGPDHKEYRVEADATRPADRRRQRYKLQGIELMHATSP